MGELRNGINKIQWMLMSDYKDYTEFEPNFIINDLFKKRQLSNYSYSFLQYYARNTKKWSRQYFSDLIKNLQCYIADQDEFVVGSMKQIQTGPLWKGQSREYIVVYLPHLPILYEMLLNSLGETAHKNRNSLARVIDAYLHNQHPTFFFFQHAARAIIELDKKNKTAAILEVQTDIERHWESMVKQSINKPSIILDFYYKQEDNFIGYDVEDWKYSGGDDVPEWFNGGYNELDEDKVKFNEYNEVDENSLFYNIDLEFKGEYFEKIKPIEKYLHGLYGKLCEHVLIETEAILSDKFGIQRLALAKAIRVARIWNQKIPAPKVEAFYEKTSRDLGFEDYSISYNVAKNVVPSAGYEFRLKLLVPVKQLSYHGNIKQFYPFNQDKAFYTLFEKNKQFKDQLLDKTELLINQYHRILRSDKELLTLKQEDKKNKEAGNPTNKYEETIAKLLLNLIGLKDQLRYTNVSPFIHYIPLYLEVLQGEEEKINNYFNKDNVISPEEKEALNTIKDIKLIAQSALLQPSLPSPIIYTPIKPKSSSTSIAISISILFVIIGFIIYIGKKMSEKRRRR